jgi:aspartate kinase
MEQALITGVSADRSVTLITLDGLPDTPLAVARTFRMLADAKLPVDMVRRAPSRTCPGHSELSLVVSGTRSRTLLAALTEQRPSLGYAALGADEEVGTVSLLGTGLRACQGLAATFCAALATAGVCVELLSASDVRLCALCRSTAIVRAVAALCQAFEARPEPDVLTASTDPPVGSMNTAAFAGSPR